MRPALDPAGHRVPRTKPTYLLHTWRPHRRRPFALVFHLHQHQSSCNLHLQYLAKNQSTQRCQSLITQGSDHPPVLEPHMVLTFPFDSPPKSMSKGARFWGFWCSRVRGVLAGISSIPLDLASFGGQNLGYGVPMRCSYYPQSLYKSVERF
jgi:hypothetical protein